MMQLCLLYKLPTLAVKTLLHMKINNIELTPITYSYYNQVRLKRKLKLSILYEISNHL
jgi:hypothetical protein